MNNVAFNELRARHEGAPPEELRRDRDLLDGFWESYPVAVADASLLTAQLVQAVLQAEHRKESQADTVEVEVTYEFIRTAMQRAAA